MLGVQLVLAPPHGPDGGPLRRPAAPRLLQDLRKDALRAGTTLWLPHTLATLGPAEGTALAGDGDAVEVVVVAYITVTAVAGDGRLRPVVAVLSRVP